jgi:hypothetical protein
MGHLVKKGGMRQERRLPRGESRPIPTWWRTTIPLGWPLFSDRPRITHAKLGTNSNLGEGTGLQRVCRGLVVLRR